MAEHTCIHGARKTISRRNCLNCQRAKASKLEMFIQERVKCNLLKKHGGYHGRRVYMEAEKLLKEIEQSCKEVVE